MIELKLDKIQTVKFFIEYNNFFKNLGEYLKNSFIQQLNNSFSTIIFEISKDELELLLKKSRMETVYLNRTFKGKEKNINNNVVFEDYFTFQKIIKILNYIIKSSSNNKIIFNKYRINEIFEELTNISFKEPYKDMEDIKYYIENKNNEKIKYINIINDILKNTDINKIIDEDSNISNLPSININKLSLKLSKTKNLKKLNYIEELKELYDNIYSVIPNVNNKLDPVFKQLLTRTELIFYKYSNEKSLKKKKKIIKKLKEEIINVKTILISISNKQTLKNYFLKRVNFLILLETLINYFDDKYINDSYDINREYNKLQNNLRTLLNTINKILKSINKKEVEIKEQQLLLKYKNILIINQKLDSKSGMEEKKKNLFSILKIEEKELILLKSLETKKSRDNDKILNELKKLLKVKKKITQYEIEETKKIINSMLEKSNKDHKIIQEVEEFINNEFNKYKQIIDNKNWNIELNINSKNYNLIEKELKEKYFYPKTKYFCKIYINNIPEKLKNYETYIKNNLFYKIKKLDN